MDSHGFITAGGVFSAFRRCVWLGRRIHQQLRYLRKWVFSAFRRCVWLGLVAIYSRPDKEIEGLQCLSAVCLVRTINVSGKGPYATRLQCLSAVCLVRTQAGGMKGDGLNPVFSAFRRCVWLGLLCRDIILLESKEVFSAFRRCVWLGLKQVRCNDTRHLVFSAFRRCVWLGPHFVVSGSVVPMGLQCLSAVCLVRTVTKDGKRRYRKVGLQCLSAVCLVRTKIVSKLLKVNSSLQCLSAVCLVRTGNHRHHHSPPISLQCLSAVCLVRTSPAS